jgi:CBS domain-containing protein
VMSHDVFTVRPDTPLQKAVSLLRRHRIGSLPVVKDRDLVGIITRSDILDFVLSGSGLEPGQTKRRAKTNPATRKRIRVKPGI